MVSGIAGKIIHLFNWMSQTNLIYNFFIFEEIIQYNGRMIMWPSQQIRRNYFLLTDNFNIVTELTIINNLCVKQDKPILSFYQLVISWSKDYGTWKRFYSLNWKFSLFNLKVLLSCDNSLGFCNELLELVLGCISVHSFEWILS